MNATAADARDFDMSRIDLAALASDVKALRREVDASLGEADLAHLRKVERIGRFATALGLATCWVAPNPLSMAALALGRSTRWLLMHHIGHRGYDRVPGVPARYTSKVFARGPRRFLDWADWMIPEAWIYEHNVLHHSHTGEDRDPDLIERNTEALRQSDLPMPVRYAAMGLLAASWRFSYYAPNTLRAWLDRHEKKTENESARPRFDYARALWLRCYLPYAAIQFGLIPAIFLPFGPVAAANALANSVGAEVLTNVHTFCVVGPNHTGADLYRYSERASSKDENLLRQILGTANYRCGSEVVDYGQLWLNYQIEHHLFPDLPMLKYREIQPKVKTLCEKHGIPYVQESVFARVKKMLSVAVGRTSMKRLAPSSLRGRRSVLDHAST